LPIIRNRLTSGSREKQDPIPMLRMHNPGRTQTADR
jgi:hypothetical protein